MSVIGNAKNTPLNARAGTMPDVSGALQDYFQPMTFGVVSTSVQGFLAVQTKVSVSFQGVWQPLKERDLQLKPEGQRAWSWYWLHADPSLNLEVDSVVTYLDVQYRVMAKKDYRLNGYVEYQLIEDWTGSGPTEATS